ncbi:MAG: NAD+ synthase [Candidatus Methanodesulfokora sp.]
MGYKEAAKAIEGFIRGMVEGAGANGVVIGISGGLDSSTVAILSVRALGKERVIGLIMPMPGITSESDLRLARELSRDLGINFYEIDIGDIYSSYERRNPLHDRTNRVANGNLQARIRMSLLYYAANSKNMLVAGTSDRSEILLGYFTKYGDGASDMIPIGDLYKTQVRSLAMEIGVPEEIVRKPSSPGLWVGQTAEGEIGLSYDVIDRILEAYFDLRMPESEIPEKLGIDEEAVKKVIEMSRKSAHKRAMPPKPSVRMILR